MFPAAYGPDPCPWCVYEAQPAVWPSWRQWLGVVLLAVLSAFLIAVGVLYCVRRRSPLIEQRQPVLIAVVWASGFLSLFVPLREVLGEGVWPCLANLVLLYTVLDVSIAVVAARIVTLYKRHRQQARMLGHTGLLASGSRSAAGPTQPRAGSLRAWLARSGVCVCCILASPRAAVVPAPPPQLASSPAAPPPPAPELHLQRQQLVSTIVEGDDEDGEFDEDGSELYAANLRGSREGGVTKSEGSGSRDSGGGSGSIGSSSSSGGGGGGSVIASRRNSTASSVGSPSFFDNVLSRMRIAHSSGQLLLFGIVLLPLAVIVAVRVALDPTARPGFVGCRYTFVEWTIVISQTLLVFAAISVLALQVRSLPDAMRMREELMLLVALMVGASAWLCVGKVSSTWDTVGLTSDYAIVLFVFAHITVTMAEPVYRTYKHPDWAPVGSPLMSDYSTRTLSYVDSMTPMGTEGFAARTMTSAGVTVISDHATAIFALTAAHPSAAAKGATAAPTVAMAAMPATGAAAIASEAVSDASAAPPSSPAYRVRGAYISRAAETSADADVRARTDAVATAASATGAASQRRASTLSGGRTATLSDLPPCTLTAVQLARLSSHDRTVLECGGVLQSWATAFDRSQSHVLLRCLTDTPIGQHFFSKSLAREFAVEKLRFLVDVKRFESSSFVRASAGASSQSEPGADGGLSATVASAASAGTEQLPHLSGPALAAQHAAFLSIMHRFVDAACATPLHFSDATLAQLRAVDAHAVAGAGGTAGRHQTLDGAALLPSMALEPLHNFAPIDPHVFAGAKAEIRSRLAAGPLTRFIASEHFSPWRRRVIALALRLGLTAVPQPAEAMNAELDAELTSRT